MIRFFVPGIPQPGGSKKGFPVKLRNGGTRTAIVEDAKHNAQWRAVVSLAASHRFLRPIPGPIGFRFEFVFPRPRGHYGTGRNRDKLKASAPHWHTIKPDATKLTRSTEDALKGIAWEDDCRAVQQEVEKHYGETPGCWISIWPVEEPRFTATTTDDCEA